MKDVPMFLLSGILTKLCGAVPMVRRGMYRDGDGRGLPGVRLLVENLVVFFAGIIHKMSVASCGFKFLMARKSLGKSNVFAGKVGSGNEMMTKIMDTNGFRINARFDGAALEGVPHAARFHSNNPLANPLIVTNKERYGFREITALSQVITQGIHSTIGNMRRRFLSAFAYKRYLALVPVNATDKQAASLTNAQAGIRQKQNKCSISPVLKAISYSRAVVDNLGNSSPVEVYLFVGVTNGKFFIDLLKERCIDAMKAVQAFDCGPAKGLRRWVHSRGINQKLFIRFFCEIRIVSNSVAEHFQRLLIRAMGLTATRTLFDEIKVFSNQFLHNGTPLSNAYYIE
jgi:hypothetical protein